MFLRTNPSQTGYTRDGEQRAGGPFLLLFNRDVGGELRACVRSVRLRQCGHFMMGRVKLAEIEISLSGAFGSDGLPLDCEEKERAPLWDQLTPVPAEIAELFWRDDSGWNGPGVRSGPALRQWAIENERRLRRLECRTEPI